VPRPKAGERGRVESSGSPGFEPRRERKHVHAVHRTTISPPPREGRAPPAKMRLG
jgi:hypothetical protein